MLVLEAVNLSTFDEILGYSPLLPASVVGVFKKFTQTSSVVCSGYLFMLWHLITYQHWVVVALAKIMNYKACRNHGLDLGAPSMQTPSRRDDV